MSYVPEIIFNTVVVEWSDSNGESSLTMYNTTIANVKDTATYFGYVAPVWYKPWQRGIRVVKAVGGFNNLIAV